MKFLSRIGHKINAWCISFLLIVVYIAGFGISAIMKKAVYLFKRQHRRAPGWHSPTEKLQDIHSPTSAY